MRPKNIRFALDIDEDGPTLAEIEYYTKLQRPKPRAAPQPQASKGRGDE